MNPGAGNPSVGVVVVSYASEAVLPSCLGGLTGSGAVEVVVVDNHSSDRSCEVAKYFGAKVISLDGNRGFAGACNLGVAALERRNEWLAFVNPDVVIDAESLQHMASRAPGKVVAISPLLLDDNGRPHRDLARPEPTFGSTAARYLLSGYFDRPARRAYEKLLAAGPGLHSTEVTSGACLIIRSDAFAAAGGFPEAYFLNMEDVELSVKLRKQGGAIVVDKTVTALHVKGSSSAGVAAITRLAECARAEAVFFRRCRPAWQSVLMTPVLFAGVACRAIVTARRSGGWNSQSGVILRKLFSALLTDGAASVGGLTDGALRHK